MDRARARARAGRRTRAGVLLAMLALGLPILMATPAQAEPVTTTTSMMISPASGAVVGEEVTFEVTVAATSGSVPVGRVDLYAQAGCGQPGALIESAPLPVDGSGKVTLKHTFTSAQTYYPIACFEPTDVTALESRSNTGNVTYEVGTGTPPSIQGTPPPGKLNETYSYTFSTSGYPAPTVRRTAGTLPPGLTLSSDGTLSGIPTRVGTYRYTVTATNDSGSASKSVTQSIRGYPVITVRGSNVVEGNSGTKPLTFQVRLSRASTLAITVRYATAHSSAMAPADFAAVGGTLTFTPGQTAKTVNVLVKGELKREPNEVFFLLLSAPTRSTISTSSAAGGILNND